jgi:hypothetical protein
MSSSSSSSSSGPAHATGSATRSTSQILEEDGTRSNPQISEEEGALQALFAGGIQGGNAGENEGVDVMKGSERAAALVMKQCATSVANSAKALMEHPQWLLGLVFILVDESDGVLPCHVVWQIAEFRDATQTVVAKRVHARHDIAEQISIPLSTVEVLIAPTLPFLEKMIATMGAPREAATAKFPISGNILTVSFGKWNRSTNAMEFDLLHVDGSIRNKL